MKQSAHMGWARYTGTMRERLWSVYLWMAALPWAVASLYPIPEIVTLSKVYTIYFDEEKNVKKKKEFERLILNICTKFSTEIGLVDIANSLETRRR
jgi:hypothetical protein